MAGIDRQLLHQLSQAAPSHLDLTNSHHQEALRSVAEACESLAGNAAELEAADRRLAGDASVPVFTRVALKLATSRLLFRELRSPTHVSVVFAVYKEHLRILTAREHPAGEDLVREKLRQLRWLFGPTPQHSWDLTVVDDGCPERSGRLIESILDGYAESGEEVRVLFLEDAIAQGLPIVGDMASPAQSRKGGSIRLGLWSAAQTLRPTPRHLALFTDADLSTHLGQIGLLASPLMDPSCIAAVGSRREPTSIVVKTGVRNVRGKLFVYLWKRLVPQLRGIVDTQCGFKAFDARRTSHLLEKTHDTGFSFDLELLLRCQLDSCGSVTKVPVAWIDSEVASTTTALDPYLSMLQSIAGLYRSTLPSDPGAEPFARLIEQLDREAFGQLVADIPPDLANREPSEFDDYDGTTAHDLARMVGLSL